MQSIKQKSIAAAVLAAALAGLTLPARAHINYVDLSDALASPGGVNGSSFSNFGWYRGTTPTLGDSHELAGGDFFKFHLAQDSLVSLTFTDNTGAGALNPAFSLYRGLLPDEGHDDAASDPLNPKAATPPFSKLASPVDNGLAADAYGRISPLRDTAHVAFAGQFDALHNWSVANESGDWSVAEYLTHVSPTGGNSVALLNYFLSAGDYTVAAAGGMACDGVACLNAATLPLTGLPGTVSFSASPVPEPSAICLLLGGLAAIGLRSRKRV